MAAVWYRTRAALRERWRDGVVLVLLIGVAGGALLTTVAGARRSSTAYDRFRATTLAADLDITFDGPPTEDMVAASREIEALPQIEALARASFPFIVPAGGGMYPYLDFLAIVGVDDDFGTTVDVPVVVDGRRPDPGSPGEAAVTQSFAQQAGVEIGDRLAMESYAPDQMEALFSTGDAGAPAGPDLTLEVVGVLSAPIFVSDSTTDFQPKLFLSRAFVDEHGDRVATYPGGFTARLRGGAADVPAVDRALRELFPDATEIEISPSTEVDRRIDSSIDVIVTALLLCALVAGVAGTLVLGQALGRYQSHQSDSAPVLAALGMDRRARVLAGIAATVPIAVVGAALAVLVAVVASPLMPVGIARRAEPARGVSVDGTVLGIGSVGIVAVVLALSWVGATAAARTHRATTRPGHPGVRARAVGSLQRAGMPPAATVGAAMALDPRAGTGWAVRSAVAGVGLGAAAVTAVLVFGASVDGLVADPGRFGAPYDAAVSGFTYDVVDGAELSSLQRDGDIVQMGTMRTDIARLDGHELNIHAFEPIKGDPAFTLLQGRTPERSGEVALGAQTLDDAGLDIGDHVRIQGTDGGVLEARVVGTTAFPVTDERSAAGRGALLAPDDLTRIADPAFLGHDLLVRWADDVDAATANDALGERLDAEVFAPRTPSDVKNLHDVAALPRALAASVAVLAALAAVHALVSTVRLRRSDLAVLAVLGLRRRDLRTALAWQGTTITVLGLVVGLPLGLVIGRAAWRVVARGIGVVDDPVVPLAGVALVVVAALVLSALTTVAPARALRRLRPGSALRRP